MMKASENDLKIFGLIDNISELVYVADLDNYDILYVNDAGRKKFGFDKQDGLKCYKALQGRDTPCPFCTNSKLKPDETYTWEFSNPVVGGHFILKDSLVDWNGRPARLEIAFDISESQNEKLELKNALDSEKMVLDCVRVMYETKDISDAMNEVLKLLGDYFAADRSYIFQIQNSKMFNTYEWCKEGVVPEIDLLQSLDLSIIDPWKEQFEKHECMVIENLEDFKGLSVYDVLKPQGINSLVIAPLEQDGELIGYFGVDNPPFSKLKNIISPLDTLRYFIMLSFQKKAKDNLLEHLSLHDTLTGLYNRNKYILDIGNFSSSSSSVGIIYMDINGLKEINDQFGHLKGDQLLIECSKIVQSVFTDADIYRTGGDEFIVICRLDNEEVFSGKVTELKSRFCGNSSCNVAIGYQWHECPTDIEALIELADNCMYEDKQRFYRNNICPRSKRYHTGNSFEK